MLFRLLCAAIALIALSAPPVMAIEEPDFELLHRSEDYEIRRYAPYIVAEVDVDGGHTDAGSKAFRILAGYIFGDNRTSKKMAMTAPVESAGRAQGVEMAMTAPVTSTLTSDGKQRTVAFVMEKKYTLETLPVPNDERIRIRTRPARVMAVIEYSGRWSEQIFADKEAALLQALKRDGIQLLGAPVLARYDAPFKPWFLRRNETMVEIAWPDHAMRID